MKFIGIKQVEYTIKTCNEKEVTIICKLDSWHIKDINGMNTL